MFIQTTADNHWCFLTELLHVFAVGSNARHAVRAVSIWPTSLRVTKNKSFLLEQSCSVALQRCFEKHPCTFTAYRHTKCIAVVSVPKCCRTRQRCDAAVDRTASNDNNHNVALGFAFNHERLESKQPNKAVLYALHVSVREKGKKVAF